jgi:hypothetical protein
MNAPFVVTLAGILMQGCGYTDGTAYYTGDITAERNRAFFDRERGRVLERLVITSHGGEVEAGIALGTWVFDQALDVDVPEYCLSSCANYVFPAGLTKIIRPGAVVAWHGSYRHLWETGLWQDEVAARRARYGEDAATARERALAFVKRLVRLEDEHFARIGINGDLCWIGKIPPFDAPNYYFLGERDMARFGIHDLHVPIGYEYTDVTGLGVHVMYIDLTGLALRNGPGRPVPPQGSP